MADDEHEHDELDHKVMTPYGVMTMREFDVKQKEIIQKTEANTIAVSNLFERLDKDDLHALKCILVAIQGDFHMCQYFIGMTTMAQKLRFGDEDLRNELLAINSEGDTSE